MLPLRTCVPKWWPLSHHGLNRKMRALIIGVTGQDGCYLASHLLAKGYTVIGAARDPLSSENSNLSTCGLRGQITCLSCSVTDFRSIISTILRAEPTEIYNLSGQTSVGLSFEQPVETFESITVGTINLLEAIRLLNSKIRFYNASSSEMFGDTRVEGAVEGDPLRPRSPYGVAKAASHWAVSTYRDGYGLRASSGILFNHESPLRSTKFVTAKVIRGAADIAEGRIKKLVLGSLGVQRDWGWAPEYVDAMHRMLVNEVPGDYVIATGILSSLERFVDLAFGYHQLNWRDWVVSDERFMRPSDINVCVGNPSKALAELGWRATITMPDLVTVLCDAERRRRAQHVSDSTAAR
jgi:GDPmannose 4,6-dehydratase